jgi:hypothetical protein
VHANAADCISKSRADHEISRVITPG